MSEAPSSTRRALRPAPTRRRALGASATARGLTGVVALLVVLAAAAMAATWPSGVREVAERAGLVDTHVRYVTARVTESRATRCDASVENTRPDGSLPDAVPCVEVHAIVLDKAGASVHGRTVVVHAPDTVHVGDVPPGTLVVLEHYPAMGDAPETWAWSDFSRTVPLGALAFAFALVTVLVARWRGLRAIVGLAVAGAVLWLYLLPTLVTRTDVLVPTLAAAVVVMTAVVYLSHGFSTRSTTALLGTFVGLGLVTATGAIAVAAAHLTGVTSQEDYQLAQVLGGDGVVTLRGIFLAGVLLAGLGVLNDVTITQSSAVWELRAARADASWADLFAGGMRIGRDHIASTIYTIVFAYAGASLPVLLLLQLYRLPVGATLTSATFAEEVVRTLAGAIGLVLAVPATTALAAWAATRTPPDAAGAHGHAH